MKDVSQADKEKNFPLVTDKSLEKVVNVSGVSIGGIDIVVMAGPCAVESYSQVMDIAKIVSDYGAKMLRGGAYKPLTHPYHKNFFHDKHGELGLEGLKYLREAGGKYNLPVVSEVTDIRKVEEVANYVDMLQIGARNMQHFPLLVEVAKTKKPVLLKRHPGMSHRDLLGAAEYILYEGNKNVVLCERGISAPHTHTPNSRFLPDIASIYYLKQHTNLPVIYDPSHSTFDRGAAFAMAKASIAAGADGLIIDVHPDPPNAMVDPLQALDYESFDKLMKELKQLAKAVGRNL